MAKAKKKAAKKKAGTRKISKGAQARSAKNARTTGNLGDLIRKRAAGKGGRRGFVRSGKGAGFRGKRSMARGAKSSY
jgi:hypothetical protein